MILFPEKPVFFVAQNLKKTKAIGLGKKLKCEDNFLFSNDSKPFKDFQTTFKSYLGDIA